MSRIFNEIVTGFGKLFWQLLRLINTTADCTCQDVAVMERIVKPLSSYIMAALNIPLITWCVIVAAMTVLITVRLFKNEHRHMHTQHSGHLIEIGSESEELFAPGDSMPNRRENR